MFKHEASCEAWHRACHIRRTIHTLSVRTCAPLRRSSLTKYRIRCAWRCAFVQNL
ncbi:hypothetical protein BDY19DRAFT_945535 [Irpex rosettiformis]|uniref:Uncharacterized protein n=1 Tax=Irpex rosettiformis TaxID=378272 RepID=A0ACB8U526_9APHY|nr:hypothetical protein BDY19DRAFT_945535 [Irpex rosettiformis]